MSKLILPKGQISRRTIQFLYDFDVFMVFSIQPFWLFSLEVWMCFQTQFEHFPDPCACAICDITSRETHRGLLAFPRFSRFTVQLAVYTVLACYNNRTPCRFIPCYKNFRVRQILFQTKTKLVFILKKQDSISVNQLKIANCSCFYSIYCQIVVAILAVWILMWVV